MRVIFCDVGQGDGLVITKNSFQMIIDTGPENGKMLSCLEKHMPFWDKEIETVIVTHWDKDHSGGLKKIISNYRIDKIYGSTSPGKDYEQIVYTDDLRKNDLIKYDLMTFEVLNPDRDWGNDNDNSIAGKLTYKDCEFLLMGDVSAEVERKMVWRNEVQRAKVIKISHHGSAGATSEEFIEQLKPKEAVVSVGKNNFGHPSGLIIERLQKWNVEVKRTDEKGDIVYLCQ